MKNMKVMILISSLLMILSCFCSCSCSSAKSNNVISNDKQVSTSAKSDSNEQMTLFEKGANYQIYQFNYSKHSSEYVYFIYDNDNKRLDCDTVYSYEPHVKEYNKNILKCTISRGSNADVVKYYNVTDDKISPVYENICYESGDEVAYIHYNNGHTYLKMQKLFSTKAYFVKELDMGGIMTTKFDVKVDGDSISITHAKGKDYKEVTETFKDK